MLIYLFIIYIWIIIIIIRWNVTRIRRHLNNNCMAILITSRKKNIKYASRNKRSSLFSFFIHRVPVKYFLDLGSLAIAGAFSKTLNNFKIHFYNALENIFRIVIETSCNRNLNLILITLLSEIYALFYSKHALQFLMINDALTYNSIILIQF